MLAPIALLSSLVAPTCEIVDPRSSPLCDDRITTALKISRRPRTSNQVQILADPPPKLCFLLACPHCVLVEPLFGLLLRMEEAHHRRLAAKPLAQAMAEGQLRIAHPNFPLRLIASQSLRARRETLHHHLYHGVAQTGRQHQGP